MIFRVMVLGCLLAVAHRAVSATEIYRTAAQPAPKYIQMADGRIGDSASSCFDCWSARSPPCASRGSALCAPQATGETGAFRPARLHLRRGRQPGPSQPLPLSAAPIFTVRYHLAVRSDDPVEIRQWNDVRALGEEASSSSITAAALSNDCRPCRTRHRQRRDQQCCQL